MDLISLSIADSFISKLISLQGPIQQKVDKFIQKFRENPKSAAINLEKIREFKDQRLRTARIDQAYRAIIFVLNEGEHYQLLYVDKHDNAIDWARDKKIQWNSLSQTMQIYNTVEIVEEKREQPVHKTKTKSQYFFDDYTDEQLLQLSVPSDLIPLIRKIKDLNDLGRYEINLPKDTFEYLFQLMDGVEYSEIVDLIKLGTAESESLIDQLKSPNNKRFVYFVEHDTDLEKLLSGDFEKWKVFLHPAQRILVERHYNGPVKVTGAAGTGKTVVAVHRAKWLSENGMASMSKPILFTTYTKSLVENLKSMINKLGGDLQLVKIENLHKYAVEKTKALGLIAEDAKITDMLQNDPLNNIMHDALSNISIDTLEFRENVIDELLTEYREIILNGNIKSLDEYLLARRTGRKNPLGSNQRKQIWSVLDHFITLKHQRKYFEFNEIVNLLSEYFEVRDEKPFSHIICDEVQDFSNPELWLIKTLVGNDEDNLFLVGDPLQRVYDKRQNFIQLGINVIGRRSRKLKINYRTTEEIKKLAISMLRDLEIGDFANGVEDARGYLSVMNGDTPEYFVFNDQAEMLEAICRQVDQLHLNEKIELKEMCIGAHARYQLDAIANLLHKKEIPYYHVPRTTGDKEGISLQTFHGLKGLEYKIVILSYIDHNNYPFTPAEFRKWDEDKQADHIKREKSLLYVAMSRAVEKLFLYGIGAKSPEIEM